MKIRVFTSIALREQITHEELSDLVYDFQSYKESGFPPDTFGRDAPYDDERTWPLVRQEQVRHIHLADAGTSWPKDILQYRRTSNKTHLVYCKGSMHNSLYLLIVLLRPDAHKMLNSSKRQKAKNPRAISLRVFLNVVGERGFEPPTHWSQTSCATKLRYSPNWAASYCCWL